MASLFYCLPRAHFMLLHSAPVLPYRCPCWADCQVTGCCTGLGPPGPQGCSSTKRRPRRVRVPGDRLWGRAANPPGDFGAKPAPALQQHLHISRAQSPEPIKCDKASSASRISDVHVIFGFKVAIASKKAFFLFCVGLFKAFSPQVTNSLNRMSSVLLIVTKNTWER